MTTKPITLRNLPPEIARAIRRRAREAGTSLNKAVIGLLEEAMGNRKTPSVKVDRGELDTLAGRWSKSEEEEFGDSLARQRQVDPEIWK